MSSDKLMANLDVVFSSYTRKPKDILVRAINKLETISPDWEIKPITEDKFTWNIQLEVEHISDIAKLNDLLIDEADHDLVLQITAGLGFVSINERVIKDEVQTSS